MAQKKMGGQVSLSFQKIIRGFLHALRRRCSKGLVLGFREMGAWVGYWTTSGEQKPVKGNERRVAADGLPPTRAEDNPKEA